MNYFLEAFRKYAEFDGRASRKEFWLFILFTMVIGAIIQLVGGGSQSFLSRLYQLITIIPAIAVAVRRIHDVGKSGWFILIPIYNIILYCTKGDVGVNKYGTESVVLN